MTVFTALPLDDFFFEVTFAFETFLAGLLEDFVAMMNYSFFNELQVASNDDFADVDLAIERGSKRDGLSIVAFPSEVKFNAINYRWRSNTGTGRFHQSATADE